MTYLFYLYKFSMSVISRGCMTVTVIDAAVVGSTPTRVNSNSFFYYILIIIYFYALVPKQKRGVYLQPLYTQCLETSTENRDQSVLALGSLYLNCYVRDTV